LAESDKHARKQGRVVGDAEVIANIRRILSGAEHPVKTRVLKELRDEGIACEQSRFARLYTQVIEQH
jgi:hypothetical protein